MRVGMSRLGDQNPGFPSCWPSTPGQGQAAFDLTPHPIPQQLPSFTFYCVLLGTLRGSHPQRPVILWPAGGETHLCCSPWKSIPYQLQSSLLSVGFLYRLSNPHWHNYVYSPAIMTSLGITPSISPNF